MTTRIIGIDLAIEAQHKAIVLDPDSNEFVSSVLSFHTDPADLAHVLAVARQGTTEEVRLLAVMEATGMAWFSVGSYLASQGVDVYRVNGQQVSELRRVYQRRAKSDRIDARVLARLPLLCPERLHSLHLPVGAQLALQRALRETARLTTLSVATKNRLWAADQLAWPGLPDVVSPYSDQALWLRTHWYDPWHVLTAGEEALVQAWTQASPTQPAHTAWVKPLLQLARRVVALSLPLDYGQLQASVQREQDRLLEWQQQLADLRRHTVRPLYRQLHPQRHLETIRGIGQDSAAVYIAFIGDIQRFPSIPQFRGWSGLLPFSAQSANAQAQGLHISKAGPDLLKATAFLNANVARRWDPQLAAIYYRQVVEFGKHHNQAVCACATHLLNRVYAVLHQQRPYQLRDVDGTPLTAEQARNICLERYHVPPTVRQRNNHRVRQERAEQRVEQRYLKRHKK